MGEILVAILTTVRIVVAWIIQYGQMNQLMPNGGDKGMCTISAPSVPHPAPTWYPHNHTVGFLMSCLCSLAFWSARMEFSLTDKQQGVLIGI